MKLIQRSFSIYSRVIKKTDSVRNEDKPQTTDEDFSEPPQVDVEPEDVYKHVKLKEAPVYNINRKQWRNSCTTI